MKSTTPSSTTRMTRTSTSFAVILAVIGLRGRTREHHRADWRLAQRGGGRCRSMIDGALSVKSVAQSSGSSAARLL
jgi:hypothetical protein